MVAASEVLAVLIVWAVLAIVGAAVHESIRWFAAAYIPAIMVVRMLAKRQSQPSATKGAIITLFITFLPFIVILLRQT